MTPKEQEVLTSVLQANRRALSLLDKRIDDLMKSNPTLLETHDVEHRQPFFYCAIGSDGESGIPKTSRLVGLTQVLDNPAFGYIRTEPDSSFVLTSIAVCLSRRLRETIITVNGGATTNDAAKEVGLRFYDESSSRWITFTNQNNQPQQNATFPSETFSPYSSFNEGGFALSAECVFPRSAVIRVEAYYSTPTSLNLFSDRLQVVFGGYKVYGG